MPVCLHCGEIGPDGALFCGKCGYTLPQEGAPPSPAPSVPPGPALTSAAPPRFASPAAVVPPRLPPTYAPPGAYAVPGGSVPGAVGPIPPPPNAKYCRRCATVISSAAVYCPVCQQPQG